MAVLLSIAAHLAMAGKSKNSIRTTSNSNFACMAIAVRSHTVPTIIQKWIASILCQAGYSLDSQDSHWSPPPPSSPQALPKVQKLQNELLFEYYFRENEISKQNYIIKVLIY